MRVSRLTGVFTAALFLLPALAHAEFHVQGDAPPQNPVVTGDMPTATLPSFRAQAYPSPYGMQETSNPANYYGAPTYAAAPLPPLPGANSGYDPGVGPQMAQSPPQPLVPEDAYVKEPVSYSTTGQTSMTYGTQNPYAQLGAQTGYGNAGYGATGAAGYGTYPKTAQNGAAQAYPSPGYGSSYAAPSSPQPSGYAAPGYGMSGYGSTYSPQTGYGAQASAQAPSGSAYGTQPSYGAGYGSAYAQPQPASSGSYGSYAASTKASAQQPNMAAVPTYGTSYSQSPSSSYGASSYGTSGAAQQGYGSAGSSYGGMSSASAPAPSSYGAQGYGASQPQGSSPYGGSMYAAQNGYGGQPQQQAYAPQAQPDYNMQQGYGGYAGQGYAPAPQPVYAQPYGAPPQPMYAPPVAPTASPDMSMQSTPSNGGYDSSARYSSLDYNNNNGGGASSSAAMMGATPRPGAWYISLRTGFTDPQDTRFTDLSGAHTGEYKTGWEIGGALGYQFPSVSRFFTPRVELEASDLRSSIDKQTVAGVQSSDPNAFGTTNTWRVFGNGYLDLNTPWRRWFTPYIGGGVGVGIADFDRHGTNATGIDLSESATGFAYNVGGGISFSLGGPMMVDVGYRYSQVLDLDLTATDGTTSKTDIGAHEFTLGLRFPFMTGGGWN